MSAELLGVDVGGSSIKLGRVAVARGELIGELVSLPTPQPSTPERVLEAAMSHPLAAGCAGPLGLAFPAVVKAGRARTAANVDDSWLGVDAAALLADRWGRSCAFLNDADAAGLGTGIGSAPFIDGRLMPNTELGHMAVAGLGEIEAEAWASARTRAQLALDWPAWAARLDQVLGEIHRLFWPDLFILGGAVSEHFSEWGPLLRVPVEVRAAALGPAAGAIGAALAAHERYNP
jgi:polyphosphate glucokinase